MPLTSSDIERTVESISRLSFPLIFFLAPGYLMIIIRLLSFELGLGDLVLGVIIFLLGVIRFRRLARDVTDRLRSNLMRRV